jgi:hypothetical protein
MLVTMQLRQNLLYSYLLSETIKIKIYKTTVLHVVLYECKTWYLISREEHKLSFFNNRVLRRISGPKMNEITECWRKRYDEKLHNLYSSQNIIRMVREDEMGRTCSTHGKDEKCMQHFDWKA